jgi:ankyrin repeat protein
MSNYLPEPEHLFGNEHLWNLFILNKSDAIIDHIRKGCAHCSKQDMFAAALYWKDEQVAQWMVNSGQVPIRVNATQRSDNSTVLHKACALGWVWVAKKLLNPYGADLQAKCCNGQTPLDWAGSHGKLRMFCWLKNVCGADISHYTTQGFLDYKVWQYVKEVRQKNTEQPPPPSCASA